MIVLSEGRMSDRYWTEGCIRDGHALIVLTEGCMSDGHALIVLTERRMSD